MVVSLLLSQKRHPPKKKNAKAATLAMAEVTNVAKAAMASAAKGVTVAGVVTAVVSVRASVRVSAQASATSAQKAHRQKRVNPAPRAKAVATIAKVSVMLNGVVSARRVNAVKP